MSTLDQGDVCGVWAESVFGGTIDGIAWGSTKNKASLAVDNLREDIKFGSAIQTATFLSWSMKFEEG